MVDIRNMMLKYFKGDLFLDSVPYILLYMVLFIINPTIALLVSAITLFGTSHPTQRQYYIFYILLACWIGVLNMTKQLFSDQIYYANIFVRVDAADIFKAIWYYRGKDFLSYKEIIFNVYSVLCNILTGGNPRAYFFILTVNIYLLHFLALHKVLFASEKSKQEVLCAVILLAFFTPLFIQSVHAVRQMLATSFIVYAIAYRAVEKRNFWLFLVIAFFIHNTSIFFIVLALLPYLYKKLELKQIFIFLLLFELFIIFYTQIGILLNVIDMGVLSSVGRRLVTSGNDESNLFSLRAFYIYGIPMLIASFSILKREYRNEFQTPIICFSYLSILLFLLIWGFTGAPTVQFRYMFYMYSFIPFTLPFLGESDRKIQRIYCFVVTVFFVLRFFMVDIDWDKFADWSEILTSPFFHFWNTVYYNI